MFTDFPCNNYPPGCDGPPDDYQWVQCPCGNLVEAHEDYEPGDYIICDQCLAEDAAERKLDAMRGS